MRYAYGIEYNNSFMEVRRLFVASLIISGVLGVGLGSITAHIWPLTEQRVVYRAVQRLRGATAGTDGDMNSTDSARGTASTSSSQPQAHAEVAAAGTTFETTVFSEGIGNILVQVSLPDSSRYSDGSPVLVSIPTFFTPERSGFHPLEGVTQEGVISISFMYPGRSDDKGNVSDGEDDYGGEDSRAALRDVLLFALGKKTNSEGFTLDELSVISPLYSNVGIYAFSHPGLAAMAVLGTYASDLQDVAFFVGRENPTLDLMSSLELGHWESISGKDVAIKNKLYTYPADYSSEAIDLDYSSIAYDATEGVPFFDVNHDGVFTLGEFALGTQTPKMFGKRYYSSALLHALEDNGVFTSASWPTDLATPEEADALWPSREAQTYYPLLSSLRNLHAMLVFSADDHVQVVADKPHIHQAYDGLRGAGIWVRLNPDMSYMQEMGVTAAKTFTEHDANTEPADWSSVATWSFTNNGNSVNTAPIAAVLEMADRTQQQSWEGDLSSLLVK